MPAGEHHHLGGASGAIYAWFRSSQPDGLEPLDQLLALSCGVGIFWALVRVINDPKGIALAGKWSPNASSNTATAIRGEPVADGGGVLGEGMTNRAVVVPRFSAMGVGQLS